MPNFPIDTAMFDSRLSNRGPTTLRTRLTVIVALIATLAIAATLVALRVGLAARLDASLERDQRARVNRIYESLAKTAKLPSNEPFAQVIAPADDGWEFLSQTRALEEDKLLLTDVQLNLALNQAVRFDTEVMALGGRARLLAMPVTLGNTRLVVLVGSSITELDRTRNVLIATLTIGGLMLVVLSAVGAWLLAGAVLRPVQRMTDDAAAIATSTTGSTLRRRLELPKRQDEIVHLGATFNSLLDRVENAVRRERAFVDDASHELRTPLTILRGELELAASEAADARVPFDPQQTTVLLERLSREVDRLGHLAEDLLVLAKARSQSDIPPVNIELLSLATRTAGRIPHRIGCTGVPIHINVAGEPCNVLWRSDHAERVLTNLLDNASRFAGSRVAVNLATSAEQIEIVVSDDGPGFTDDFLPQAFERFAIADRARTRSLSGTGLGLAIVKELVEAAGGQVAAGRGDLGGAQITIAIPHPDNSQPSQHWSWSAE
jgi:two-component system, OmpR family, sensor kinase